MASDDQDLFAQQKDAVATLVKKGKEAYDIFLEAFDMLDFLNEEEKEYITGLKLEKIIYSEDESGFDSCEDSDPDSDPVACVSLECDGPRPNLRGSPAPANETRIVFSPGIRNEIIKIIKESSTSIKIAMFMFTEASIFNAICERKLATPSIAVHILIDESQFKEFKDMAEKTIKKKFKNKLIGINVKDINKQGKFPQGQRVGKAHEKFMIVDGSFAITGSFNFTWASEHINYEHIIISQDKDAIVTPLLKHFRILAKRDKYEVL